MVILLSHITSSCRRSAERSGRHSTMRTATVSCGNETGSANPHTFTDLPFAVYQVSASASGYDSAESSVTITADSTDKTVTLKLKKQLGTITVNVRDASTKQAIKGASVSSAAIEGAAVTTSGLSRTTDASGVTTFSSLSFGTYTFSASASDYIPSTGSTTISTSKTTASITIYLERLKTDLSIRAFCNGDIYKGSTIIVTAEIVYAAYDSNVDHLVRGSRNARSDHMGKAGRFDCNSADTHGCFR